MKNIIGVVSGGQLLRYEYNGKTISREDAVSLRNQGAGYEERNVNSAQSDLDDRLQIERINDEFEKRNSSD